jgi:hypothetical protein
MAAAETLFSLAEELPAEDGDRESDNDLQPGTLTRGSLKEICFLRKISPLGAVIQSEAKRRAGERLDLTLMTGERLAGTVSWVAENELGLRFDDPADIFGLIARNLVRQPGDARRMPRIELRCQAWLEAGSRRDRVILRNLTDGGARLDTRLPLVAHEQVVLIPDGFRPIEAEVRWAEGGAVGLSFAPTLSWQELMPWLRQRQPVSARRSAPLPPRVADVIPNPRIAATERQSIGLNLPAKVREGTKRWAIDIEVIDTREVRFTCYAALEAGRLFWISLPGLEGWPARISSIDGYTVTCQFTQPLHPAVLERVLALAGHKPKIS